MSSDFFKNVLKFSHEGFMPDDWEEFLQYPIPKRFEFNLFFILQLISSGRPYQISADEGMFNFINIYLGPTQRSGT